MKPALPHPSAASASHTCAVGILFGLFLVIAFSFKSYSQEGSHTSLDTTHNSYLIKQAIPPSYIHEYPYDKKKVRLVAIGHVAVYSVAMASLYSTWYKDYPQTHFHVFDDMSEWEQLDKIGHVYSAYALSKASMETWRRTGMERKKRIWLGGISGAAYQTVVEVLDGFSSQWGWSWGDFAANIFGSGMMVAQELAWDEQKIQMKWSFHPTNYSDPKLDHRADIIFGNSLSERMLKDYNGQTYWLSYSLKSMIPESNLPRWLQISVGTGVEGVFGARENRAFDKDGAIVFERQDIKRVRQWYLAPDIDLTRIKTKKRGIKLALDILNVIKFPAPTLEYAGGKVKWHWLYF